MGNIYVSTHGNDTTGNGTASTPWATIQKAIDDANAVGEGLRADDTLWIAPGIYYEQVTMDVSSTSAPSAGHEVLVKGDPNLTQSWGTSETPGQIVITCAREVADTAGEANTMQVGVAFNFNSKANVWVYDIQGHGGNGTADSSGTAVYGDTGSNQKLIRCVAISTLYAFRYALCEYCVGIASVYPYGGCTASNNGGCKHCIGISGTVASYYSTLDNCIGISGTIGADDSVVRNSFLLAGGTGLLDPLASCDNNILMGYRGIDISGQTQPDSNLLIATYNNANAADDISTNREIWTYSKAAATDAADAHILEFPPAMQIIQGLSEALKPETFRDFDMADGSGATSETTDIEGRPRTAYGKKHSGCWALGSQTYDDDLIQITGQGAEVIYIPIPEDSQVTVTVDITCSHPGTADTWPSIELSGPGISTQTDTAVDTTDTLTVTVPANEPTQNAIAKIMLKANDTETSHYTKFENIRVTS